LIAPALRRAIEKPALAEERSISNFTQKVLGGQKRHNLTSFKVAYNRS
jgi:hypothetical protein